MKQTGRSVTSVAMRNGRASLVPQLMCDVLLLCGPPWAALGQERVLWSKIQFDKRAASHSGQGKVWSDGRIRMYTIYLIIDSRDQVPVYVGQSRNIEIRWATHQKVASAEPRDVNALNIKYYLNRLFFIGYSPEFKIVSSCDSEEESLRQETEWVRRLISDGYPLLNNWKLHKKLNKDRFGQGYKEYFRERLAGDLGDLTDILNKYRNSQS